MKSLVWISTSLTMKATCTIIEVFKVERLELIASFENGAADSESLIDKVLPRSLGGLSLLLFKRHYLLSLPRKVGLGAHSKRRES